MDLGHIVYWLTGDGWALPAMVALLGGCAGIVYLAAARKSGELAKTRRGYDVNCFAAEMEEYGYDPTAARTVYEYIQEMHGVDFPIFPTDDLSQVLGMTDEDVRRALPPILEVTGRSAQLGRMLRPLETVEEMVAFVCRVQPEPVYERYEQAEEQYGDEMYYEAWPKSA